METMNGKTNDSKKISHLVAHELSSVEKNVQNQMIKTLY